jgi:quinol monooxygenase YgiN
MTALTVVATIVAKPGTEATVEQALLELVAPTRKEAGFIQFDLHRDLEKPNVFVFFENWESKALLDQHLESKHIAAYLARVDGMIENWDLKLMNKIS